MELIETAADSSFDSNFAFQSNMNESDISSDDIYEVSDSEEQEVYGTSGLYNIGNTCYMNSIVQCLSNCSVFRSYILSNDFIPNILKDKSLPPSLLKNDLENYLSFQLRKIIINIWNSSFFSFRPISFKKLFGKKIEMFQNSSQHDSQEALLCILDTFNEEIGNEIFIKSTNSINDEKFKYLLDQNELSNNETNKLISLIRENYEGYIKFVSKENFYNSHKKKYSIISDLFSGRIITELNCPITNINKVNFEPFFFLSVSLPDNDDESDTSSISESSSEESDEDDDDEEDKKQTDENDDEEEQGDDEEEQGEDDEEDNTKKYEVQVIDLKMKSQMMKMTMMKSQMMKMTMMKSRMMQKKRKIQMMKIACQ